MRCRSESPPAHRVLGNRFGRIKCRPGILPEAMTQLKFSQDVGFEGSVGQLI